MPDAVVNCVSRMLNLLFTLTLNHIALPVNSGHDKSKRQRIGSAINTVKTDPRFPQALKVFESCLKKFSQMMSLKVANQENANILDSPPTPQPSQSSENESSKNSDKPQCEQDAPCHHELALRFTEGQFLQSLAFIHREDVMIIHKPQLQKILNVDKNGKPLPPNSNPNPVPENPIPTSNPFAPLENLPPLPNFPAEMEQIMGQLFMSYLNNLNNSLHSPLRPQPMPQPEFPLPTNPFPTIAFPTNPFPTNPYQALMAGEFELFNSMLNGQLPPLPPMQQATAAQQLPQPNGSTMSLEAASIIVQANQILQSANLPLLDFHVRQDPAMFQQNGVPVGGFQKQEPATHAERQEVGEREPVIEGEAESEARSEADRDAESEEEQEVQWAAEREVLQEAEREVQQEAEREVQQEAEKEVEQDIESVAEPEAESDVEWVEEQETEPETDSEEWVQDEEMEWDEQPVAEQEPEQDSTSSSCFPVPPEAEKGSGPAN